MSAFDTIKTYTLKNNASTASLSVVKRADGSLKFTGDDGNVYVIQPEGVDTNDPIYQLLEAVDALV